MKAICAEVGSGEHYAIPHHAREANRYAIEPRKSWNQSRDQTDELSGRNLLWRLDPETVVEHAPILVENGRFHMRTSDIDGERRRSRAPPHRGDRFFARSIC